MRAKYVLTEVFVGLWRNVTMTIAMIITMAVSLTMLGASLMLYLQVGEMKDWYYDRVQVSVFLTSDITPEQTSALEKRLKDDPAVEKVFYEDQNTAYDRFKDQFRDLPDLVRSVGPESLPASFRVTLKDPERSSQFALQLEKAAGLQQVDDTTTGATPSATPGTGASASPGAGTTTATSATQPIAGIKQVVDQKKLLEKIFGIISSIQSMSLIVSVAMGVAALLLVANTIQVAAYSKRREVAVMKLVGASNWFIQAPFVLEAVFAAVLGSLLAFLALVGGKVFLMDGALKDLNQILTPLEWRTVVIMLPILAGIGALVSAVTGWVTLRAYIKK